MLTEKVEDSVELNLLCTSHAVLLQAADGTQVALDPVSKQALNHCPGLPTW